MPSSPPSQHSLSDIAERFKLTLEGGDALIDGVGTLRKATPTQISFLANPGYRPDLPQTRAAAVILNAQDAPACPSRSLVADDPYLAWARVAALFEPAPDAPPGIHPSAAVDRTATLGTDVRIGPHAVIGAHCTIGDGCLVGPGTVIQAGCRIGRDCHLHANVSVGRAVRIGERVIIHPGAVIGADGFGIARDGDRWRKVPQLGSVRIGDDCEIGANSTIDRGAVDDTVLEEDVRVDNLVQIAHNVHIGAHTAIAAMTGIAGSARIGRYCLLAGGCGIAGHIEITDRVTVGAKSSVFQSIDQPGTTWSAQIPAQPLRAWQRNLSLLRRLDEFLKRIRAVECRTGMRSQNNNDDQHKNDE